METTYYFNDSNGDVILKSGKRITLRKKTGAHHMIENRLIALCIPRGGVDNEFGVNIGDMVAMTDIKTIVAIESINGKPIKMPSNLSDVIELMSEFEYNNNVDEWTDFKAAITSDKEKIEELSKNLQSKAGSETESALHIGAERV